MMQRIKCKICVGGLKYYLSHSINRKCGKDFIIYEWYMKSQQFCIFKALSFYCNENLK